MTSIVRSRSTTAKWNLFFQYASIALSIISGVVLVPLHLKFISVDLYGAWVGTGSVLIWITLIDPGLSQVLMQQVAVAYGKKDIKLIQKIIVAGSVITLSIVGVMIMASIIIMYYIPSLLNITEIIGTPACPSARGR